MKLAIRKYLLERRVRKLQMHLQFLLDEAVRNADEQQHVIRMHDKAKLELMTMQIRSRREMMV